MCGVCPARELPLPARLGDYARMQRNHRELVADMLSSDWTIKVGAGAWEGGKRGCPATGP